MSKTVNNDISKDSPIPHAYQAIQVFDVISSQWQNFDISCRTNKNTETDPNAGNWIILLLT